MSTTPTDSKVSTRRGGPRADSIEIGIDTEGAHHVYRTFAEEVLVIEAGEITYRYALEEIGADINDWIDYVRARRGGFAEQRLFKDLTSALGGAV